LVLAGGEGSRYGGPKAWAELPDGCTFLAACARALLAAGARPLVATLPPGSVDPRIAGLGVVPLAEHGLDMFASLRVGLAELLAEVGWGRVSVLPVDHPLVRPGTIAALAATEGAAVIPKHDGKHGHPVVLDRATAAAVATERMRGPTLREVLAEVGPTEIAVDDPGTIANCNTPDALACGLARSGDV
jgi:CTP:molybdopterin cytidylyltransferase MocA